MKRSAGRKGFTLIEVLAALLFLGILIPAVLRGISIASRASEAAERGNVAGQLAENQLEQVILDGTWSTGGGRGDFGADWPLYRWELTSSAWDQDTMTQLTMKVYFKVQGREQSVQLTTLASALQSNT